MFGTVFLVLVDVLGIESRTRTSTTTRTIFTGELFVCLAETA
jgi:hypothetical protein